MINVNNSVDLVSKNNYINETNIDDINVNLNDIIDIDNNEWSNVPNIQIKYASSETDKQQQQQQQQQDSSSSVQPQFNNDKLISFNYAIEQLYQQYSNDIYNKTENHHLESLEQQNNSNGTSSNNGGGTSRRFTTFQMIVNKIIGPPKLKKDYKQQFDFILLLASKQFDDNSDIQRHMLSTLYRKLTGSTCDCPRYGPHWEMIGFQGSDPATDLRGCGILSILLTLYLFENEYASITSDIYKLSVHETQNFPFCVMGINIVRIVLNVLKQNLLNKYINKTNGSCKEIVEVCAKYYLALYYRLFHVWSSECKTINDCGFVLRDLEIKAKKSPKFLFEQLDKYVKSKQNANNGGGGGGGTSSSYNNKQANNKKNKKKKGGKHAQNAYKFTNVPKIVIDKAESIDQDFSRID